MKMLLPLLRLISRLPLGVLYVLADLCFPLLYYVARYRRKVVTENLNNAFPELSPRERHKIRRRFYRWFCDYVVETLKLLSMSRQEMMRRMIIEGVDEMERSLETKPFVFIFLGHYCNWEWVSSIPLWYQKEDSHGAQLYRPLKNKAFDGLFLEMRSRFGSENISKYEALRHILQLRRDGKRPASASSQTRHRAGTAYTTGWTSCTKTRLCSPARNASPRRWTLPSFCRYPPRATGLLPPRLAPYDRRSQRLPRLCAHRAIYARA